MLLTMIEDIRRGFDANISSIIIGIHGYEQDDSSSRKDIFDQCKHDCKTITKAKHVLWRIVR